MAAALVEMGAAFAPGVDPDTTDEESPVVRARSLREKALALAERELESYMPVLEAMRRDAGPGRDVALRTALSQAADAPLAIARCAARTADLGLRALTGGSEHLRGDVVTGVLLAEAACAAAVRLLELNLADFPDDPRVLEARRLGSAAAGARRQALG